MAWATSRTQYAENFLANYMHDNSYEKKSKSKDRSCHKKRLAKERAAGRNRIWRHVYTRTLRNSARKILHKRSNPYKYIMPGIKDPCFKYLTSSAKVRRASLLGLPAELRQNILTETVEVSEVKRWERRRLGEYIGNLSCVAPLTRLDMLTVGGKWREQKMTEEARLKALKATASAQETTARAEAARQCVGNATVQLVTYTRDRHGRVIAVREKKEKRVRYLKCWHCERRHPKDDRICPPSRENPQLWKTMTRSIEYKHPPNWGSKVFEGMRTVFED